MNTDTKTPGPWTYREAFDNGEPCGYVIQSGVNAIADVPQGEADARLIAAAPEMLAALKAHAEHFTAPPISEHPEAIKQRRIYKLIADAIKKAE